MLREIADGLRLRNLTPFGLARWAGTDRLSALPRRLARCRVFRTKP